MQRGTLEELVERQARRWEIQQRTSAPPPSLSCIALSRFPHSGAAELARSVAEKLDFGLFGIEIVDWIARARGIDRALVAELDERVRSTIDRYVLDSFHERRFSESQYLRSVVRTIVTLGERGMSVILGRGAPFVLGPKKALRVLVVAPFERRLEKLAKRESLSSVEAKLRLETEDERRQNFLAQFGVEPNDPSLYDLVVNTDSLGHDAAVTLVIDALHSVRDRAA
jgi:cytidylate kinase